MKSLVISLFVIFFAACGKAGAPGSEPVPPDLAVIVVPQPISIVPATLLDQAMAYYNANLANIPNPNYVTVVDFSKPSKLARFYLIDMKTGTVETMHVAHGSGSDPRSTGQATRFSNVNNSHMSSLGFYLTATAFNRNGPGGQHLWLDGLSPTNSLARKRAIMVHGARYVYPLDQKPGMSWGCFAVPAALTNSVIDRIKGGSLIFAGLSGE